jgi:hypothetical protein
MESFPLFVLLTVLINAVYCCTKKTGKSLKFKETLIIQSQKGIFATKSAT